VPGSGPGSLQKAQTPATDSWQEARTRLLNWNYSVDAESVTAGIYEMFQRRVSANVRNLMVPKEAQTFIGQLSMKRVIDWLQAPDGRFGSDAVKGRDELLTRSLTEAIEELTKKLGPDMNAWRWGTDGVSPCADPSPAGGYRASRHARKTERRPVPARR
jgi:penicillin amidase